MKWYDKAIPKIKDVLPVVNSSAKKLSQIKYIKNIYAWGSFATKISEKESRIKDVDIILECNFDSGDLLAIDNTKDGALNLPKTHLEELGFNPDAIDFTRKILDVRTPSMEIWAISKDKKILHWGPISETIEEWKQIKKEAEKMAESITKFSMSEIMRLSEVEQKKWHDVYEQHLNQYTNGCPQGWYAAQNNVDKIINNLVKIVV